MLSRPSLRAHSYAQKLNTILLIDHNPVDNSLCRMVIEDVGVAEHIVACHGGEEALTWLTTPYDGRYPQPELIFLDINMPRMNGWEFLERYHTLDASQKGKVIVVMLTTSLNPDDRDWADAHSDVNRFEPKPLTLDRLNRIIATYIPE